MTIKKGSIFLNPIKLLLVNIDLGLYKKYAESAINDNTLDNKKYNSIEICFKKKCFL
tara:strand:+ start:355 stop:525 length:171 start_codon:yes stop_codon:yes gene_type:complete